MSAKEFKIGLEELIRATKELNSTIDQKLLNGDTNDNYRRFETSEMDKI